MLFYYFKFFSFLFLVIICLFIAWRVFIKVFKVIKDIFIFMCLLVGERSSDHRSVDFQSKVYCFLCESNLLDETSVNDLYTFGKEYVDTNYSVHDFHKILLKQSHVAFFRDCITGSLRGFIYFRFIRKGPYTLLNLGTNIISPKYRGGGITYAPQSYITLKELIRHPFTPIYLIAKTFGYKSYLAGCNTWPDDVYPRYNQKTPEHLQKIMDEFVESILNEGEEYNRETSVIKRNADAPVLKEFTTSLPEEDKRNPHIKFFLESNPGYITGDCLFVILKVSWPNLFKVVKKSIFQRHNKSQSNVRVSRRVKKVPSPKFGRQFSFIDKSSGRYYVPSLETDFYGECQSESHNKVPQKGKSPFLYKRPTLASLTSEVDLSGF